MSTEKNNYVASVRVRMIDVANIANFLSAQGIRSDSKSKVLSAGIRFLSRNIPDNMKCTDNQHAMQCFLKLGLSDGREDENRLSRTFKKQLDDEMRNNKASDADVSLVHKIAKEMREREHNKIQKSDEKPTYKPEDLCGSEATNEQSVVTAQEGCEAKVPGNNLNQKQAMLDATNMMNNERENDE